MEENLLALGTFSLTTEPSTTDKDGDTTMKDNSNFTVTKQLVFNCNITQVCIQKIFTELQYMGFELVFYYFINYKNFTMRLKINLSFVHLTFTIQAAQISQSLDSQYFVFNYKLALKKFVYNKQY